MLKILSDSDGKYRVEDSTGTPIGWINGRVIGFRGMATESDARDATIAAWRAFDRALRQQYTGWPRYEPNIDQLRTIHDGSSEWFHDGTTSIARLLRPEQKPYGDSFGIELVLPSYASEGVAVAAALSVATAIVPYRDVSSDVGPPLGRPGGRVTPKREAVPSI